MIIIFNFLKHVFNLIKFICLILTLMYFIGYAIQVLNPVLLSKVGGYIGFLPSFFDKLVHIEGTTFSFGYILSALFFFALTILAFLGSYICFEIANELKIKKVQKDLNKKVKETIENETKNIPEKYNFYYGLFEFVFEGYDTLDLEDLKKKYTSVLLSKIKSKYVGIQFSLNKEGQIQMFSKDFSKFDMLVDEILKFYSAFCGINKTQASLYLKFSINADNKNIVNDYSFDILKEINSFNYTNKVVVTKEIYDYAKQNNFTRFAFTSLGEVALASKYTELYKLSNS